MNLFVNALDDYLNKTWRSILNGEQDLSEARFILQSLGPDEVFELFTRLEERKLSDISGCNIKCYFKVATGLWKDWCDKEDRGKLIEKMKQCGAVADDGALEWIDEKDRFTWFRNRTVQDESADKLFIVLVGLNHASDQGGLADFHRVDEKRIWQEMGRSFEPWINSLCDRLAIEESRETIIKFDTVLQRLFDVRPLQLVKLAQFIDTKLDDGQSYLKFQELVERFYSQLHYWNIPPLAINENISHFLGEKGAALIKQADKFISHQGYKTDAAQKRDLRKIVEWIEGDAFELPQALLLDCKLNDATEYRNLLSRFITAADAEAKQQLLGLDIWPLLNILNVKDKKSRNSRASIKSFGNFALESLFEALNDVLEEFNDPKIDGYLAEQLSRVTIKIKSFEHDMPSDDDSGSGADELAQNLLLSCLGGFDEIFAGLDCRLPADESEIDFPRTEWSIAVNLDFVFVPEEVRYRYSVKTPRVEFEISALSELDDNSITKRYYWKLPATQPERVFAESVQRAIRMMSRFDNGPVLPCFAIPQVNMTALYYAADEAEANRLISQAMTDMKIVDLLEDLKWDSIDSSLKIELRNFINSYQQWLQFVAQNGFNASVSESLPGVLNSYVKLVERVLKDGVMGSKDVLRRLYKAFFIIGEESDIHDEFLGSAVAWGLTPAVLEQMAAKVRFLADGFPEVLAALALGKKHQRTFTRLLDLSQVQRPIAVITSNDNQLVADIRSYGLIHYLGHEPRGEVSLAVQTLLRENDNDDDEDISDITRPCRETSIVASVIDDYLKLNPFASDGIRILAVNVKELQIILSGIEHFLKRYSKWNDEATDKPPFHFTVMVYTSASSPMVMENDLSTWREYANEKYGVIGRRIKISIGHKFVTQDTLREVIKREQNCYDIAFLFHFLQDSLVGQANPARPFTFHYDNCAFFPIAEYPRPVSESDRTTRENLISNRRLRAQTRHADMSARLSFGGYQGTDYIISGKVDFRDWLENVELLHSYGYWVACIDPFIDKTLLNSVAQGETRIVGFSSGLGSYGELNLTISTQQDTQQQLVAIVVGRLQALFASMPCENLESVAKIIVNEAEAISGLSSLRAVVGNDEKIREVIGFAAIGRALARPKGEMSQLLPLDALQHWFVENVTESRPDLLQLTLSCRDGDIPLVYANLVECKLAKKSDTHLSKAYEQIQSAVDYLPQVLAPKSKNAGLNEFDRRYWWAQLHRALSSRASVNLTQEEKEKLDNALENIAEGMYEIQWTSSIFTFWTDVTQTQPLIEDLLLKPNISLSNLKVDDDFVIKHVSLGEQTLLRLFEPNCVPILDASTTGKIRIRPDGTSSDKKAFDDIDDKVAKSSSVESKVQSNSIEPEQNTESAEPLEIHDVPTNQLRSNDKLAPSECLPDSIQNCPSDSDESDLPESTAEKETIATALEPSDLNLSKPLSSAIEAEISIDKQSETPLTVEKILIGARKNGEPVYWHYGNSKLSNRHLLIFGTSGYGKTYAIQCLLAELARAQITSTVIDYTNGFLPNQLEVSFKYACNPKSHFVRHDKLPLNPFKKQEFLIDPSLPPARESEFDVANRISNIFTSVFPTLGDQQSAALIRTIKAGLEADDSFNFSKLLEPLSNEGSNGEKMANKIRPFIESDVFRENQQEAWKEMLGGKNNFSHILQLAANSQDIQKITTEFILWDLWDYLQNVGSKEHPVPVVLDEIQNLDHRSDSPIDKMLREGRKFGLSLILATQTISQFNQEQKDRLFQAGQKLFFKPAPTESKHFAQLLAQSTPGIKVDEWMQRLSRLEKGQCWALGLVEKANGDFIEEPVLVSITSLEDRNFKAISDIQ